MQDINKSKFLKTHGWYTLWNENNWVERDKEYSNIDWAGATTDRAYEIQLQREKKKNLEREMVAAEMLRRTSGHHRTA